MGVHTRCGTVPPWWSEHLCNGSPARIETCGDHHTLMLMQGGEVLACVSNINAEGQLRIGTRNSEWYPTGLESRRDRFRRWRRGGGTRQRRACPGVTRLERCQNRAPHNQIFCVQVLICLQYGQICCRDNCSEITIVHRCRRFNRSQNYLD